MSARSIYLRTIVGVSAALLVAASAISVSNANARIPATAFESQRVPQRHVSLQHARHFLKLAQTHADICLQNEQQCLQGCDGAQSCSAQCEANYNGCMGQGG